MSVRRVLAPGLLRVLLARTLVVAVVPLLVLASVTLSFSDRLVLERFQQDGRLVAKTTASDIQEHVLLATRYANLIAELQPTRDAIATGDARRMTALLLPLKGRLGMDKVNIADPTGRLIAGAQDPQPGEQIRPYLLDRVGARAESAWVLDQEDDGLALRAVAPVRAEGRLLGIVEVATIIDSEFLRSVRRESETRSSFAPAPELAIAWSHAVNASTLTDLPVSAFPSVDEVDATAEDALVRTVQIGDRRYYAVFTLIDSHHGSFGVLGAFLSLAPVEAAHNAILTLLAAMLVALAIAIVVLAVRFTMTLTRPLAALAQAAQRIRAGDLTARVERRSPHEIGTLEETFETMARSLEEREKTNHRLVAELQQQALYDTLTRLPNRMLLLDRLEQTILASQRSGAGFSFFLMDIDRFKDINDTFGHHMGDALLPLVGSRLHGALRESDTVARLGGDEFAMLLPTATDSVGAVAVARRVLAALASPFQLEDLLLQVEASIGIAIFPEHGVDASTLIQRADVAMYRAKRSKSGFALYSRGEEEESRNRLLLLGELRQAMEEEQLALHYQPAVDPRSRRLSGFEALVRWQHPRLGLLGPGQFVPFAEQTGLILPLSEWVVEAAVRQAAEWNARGQPAAIAVNLSARDLPDPELPIRIGRALAKWEVPPGQLKLEITESAVMAEPTRSLEVLKGLRGMGIELSIDDYGTGYSSLAYLKRLPVGEIKIDRSFVMDMLSDEDAAAIVRSTVDLGHNLGLKVVAEGVESKALLDLLASFRCDLAQGYYIGRPMPADQVPNWLASSPWRPHGTGATRASGTRLPA